MPVREVYSPYHGCTVKLGCNPAPNLGAEPFHFKSYLRGPLPTPPQSVSYASPALPSLTNIFKNDKLGCCVVSGFNHSDGIFTGNAGDLYVPTDQQIIQEYSAIGGYNGTPASDTGCDPVTAANYYQNHGFGNGDKLAGYLAVDAGNTTLVQQAVDLFETCGFAMQLPDAYIDPFPAGNGFVWDVAGPPLIQNGHFFVASGFSPTGWQIVTWGLVGTFTYAASRMYNVPSAGGQIYLYLSQAAVNKASQTAPNSLDWATLIGDWDAAGGNIPVGPPTPTPGPVSGAIVIGVTSKSVYVPPGVHIARVPTLQPLYKPAKNEMDIPRQALGWTIAGSMPAGEVIVISPATKQVTIPPGIAVVHQQGTPQIIWYPGQHRINVPAGWSAH